jgi:hypothetical protein
MPFLVKRSSSVDPEDDDDERALPPGIDSPLDVDGGRRPYGEVASSGTRGDGWPAVKLWAFSLL